jgi:predicted permease
VLLAFPMAKHFASEQPGGPMWRLVMRSLLDWRSIGLPMAVAGIALSVLSVPRPAAIDQLRVVEILMYAINIAAYFGIGLQLEMSYVPVLKKLIVGLAFTRYILGAVTGLGLVALTLLTPWPLHGVAREVVLIESFVSTAVTNVAVASMFGLRPKEASVLFVTNTLLYLVVVLPLVLWMYR